MIAKPIRPSRSFPRRAFGGIGFSIERDEKIPWRSPRLDTGDDRDEVSSPKRVAAKTRRRGQRPFQDRPRVPVEAPRGSSGGPDTGPACDAGVLGVQRDEEAGCQQGGTFGGADCSASGAVQEDSVG